MCESGGDTIQTPEARAKAATKIKAGVGDGIWVIDLRSFPELGAWSSSSRLLSS